MVVVVVWCAPSRRLRFEHKVLLVPAISSNFCAAQTVVAPLSTTNTSIKAAAVHQSINSRAVALAVWLLAAAFYSGYRCMDHQAGHVDG